MPQSMRTRRPNGESFDAEWKLLVAARLLADEDWKDGSVVRCRKCGQTYDRLDEDDPAIERSLGAQHVFQHHPKEYDAAINRFKKVGNG